MTADARPSTGPVLHVLDQGFDASSLYQVRAAISAHAADLGLPLYRANDIVIAVHELASNTVRHGPGHGRLRIWTSPQALICEIADGARTSPARVGPAPAQGELPPPSCRGRSSTATGCGWRARWPTTWRCTAKATA